MTDAKTMNVPCCYPKCPAFKTVDPTEAMHGEPIHWLCEIHKNHAYKRCEYGGCDKIYFPSAAEDLSHGKEWHCEQHKMQAMIDETRCDFMSCNLQGRFTDPSLEGKWCEHHRRVMIDSNIAQAHRKEIAALKKQIEEKDMLLEHANHRLIAWRSFSTQMMVAGLTKMKSRIGDMADHQMKELEHHLRELLGDVTK